LSNAQSPSPNFRLIKSSLPDYANPLCFYSPFLLDHAKQEDWDFCDPSLYPHFQTVQVSVHKFPFDCRRSCQLVKESLYISSKPDLNHVIILLCHRGTLDLLSNPKVSQYKKVKDEYDSLCTSRAFGDKIEKGLSRLFKDLDFQPTHRTDPVRLTLHMPKLDSEKCTYNLIRSLASILDIYTQDAVVLSLLNSLQHQDNSYAQDSKQEIENLMEVIECKTLVMDQVCRWVEKR